MTHYFETSIITGKAYTGNPSASNSIVKRLYLKVFPGEFWYRAPRAKKAKIYGGELFVRYSSREWPEKKNGPLAGDPELLVGISELLRELKLQYADEIKYAKVQHLLKETITLTVGPNLAEEIVNRGWARLIEIKEPNLPKESAITETTDGPAIPEKMSQVTNNPAISEFFTNNPVTPDQKPVTIVDTTADTVAKLYGKTQTQQEIPVTTKPPSVKKPASTK